MTDFPGATHDEQWERNQKVPILYSPKELELYVSPAGRPHSPTPSFVKYFEGQCDCKQCMPNGPIHYEPDVEAEKRKLYDAWIKERVEEFEKKRLEHRRVSALPLELRRKRAILVVTGALGLDEDERQEYDEETHKRWWELLQHRFDAEDSRNRPSYGLSRWNLPSWYSFCEY